MAKGKEAKQIILNDKFWNNSLIFVRIVGPLILLLRVCDADEKPSMGYVYEGMQRAIESIRKLFKYKDRLCKPYIDIINFRWDKMLRKNLHSASYFLNLTFQYDSTYVGIKEVTNGLLDYIETYVDWCDHAKFTHEIAMFREREGSFGRKLALNTSRTDRPEPAGELDYEELEVELEELHVDDDVECSNSQQVEDRRQQPTDGTIHHLGGPDGRGTPAQTVSQEKYLKSSCILPTLSPTLNSSKWLPPIHRPLPVAMLSELEFRFR
ncbi:hypothetical protein ACH5RR_041782 [Cinchona calisaya]|uniref:Uncharacterized protein n=1 Tax=Cinchona calisaya TaxID=153742 RepID=A0ABD2XYJ1_9GENT